MKVLVTGGAGFIGSHTCVELAARGYDVAIVDSFVNSSPAVIPRIEELSGRRIECHQLDLRDQEGLNRLFSDNAFDAVIHFAGFKSVRDSVSRPLEYFDNNVGSSISLLRAMQSARVNSLVFSSSCTVYGNPDIVPVDEDAELRVTSPYGRSKLFIEQMLADVSRMDAEFKFTSLRYFNPAGAHPSGRIGEDPRGTPTNLMPLICQIAVGRRESLEIYGGDWPTPDGTCIRDYLHVMDVARAHVLALERLIGERRAMIVNLGTGMGTSVLDFVAAFERVTGKRVPQRLVGRQAGDVAAVWADPERASVELGWKAELDLDAMCADAWCWQSQNPRGFDG